MKIIAFKRAGKNPSLHPEFITEFIDSAYLESTEGYETMIQEHFDLEFAKNNERHEAHLKHLRDEELKSIKAQEQAQLIEIAQEKEDEREYKRFKAWQRHSGKGN